jgi:hypothetical protein
MLRDSLPLKSTIARSTIWVMETITLCTTRSLVPPVYYALRAVQENTFSYGYYGLRHPASIFSIHFSSVMTAFTSLAIAINNIQGTGTPCSNEENDRLKALTGEFLFQLINYFESGYEVFLCFCEQFEKPSSRQPLYRWFTSHGYGNDIQPYFTNTNSELGDYRKLFNALKHSSNRLEVFQFMHPHGATKALGLYLESVDDEGSVGPNVELHPMYQDEYTAWSYNRHIRTFYFLIYKIASEMNAAVQRLCERKGVSLSLLNIPLVSTDLETLANAALVNVANRFDGVFNVFYPQEAEMQVKTVSFDAGQEAIIFSEHVAGEQAIPTGQGWGAMMTMKGDGVSRKFSLLYRKPEKV